MHQTVGIAANQKSHNMSKNYILGFVGVTGVEVADKVIQTASASVDSLTPSEIAKLLIQLAIGLFTVYIQSKHQRNAKHTKDTKPFKSTY